MRPYVIVAPDYAHVCAGIKVLHRLCHLLNERGIPAYITGRGAGFEGYTNLRYLNELPPEQLKDIQHNGIVVYPDVVAGNPLKFDTVARWWLAINQPTPEHEICFSYASNHNVHAQATHNLFIMYIEEYFRIPEQENRYQTCFRVHKGAHVPRIPETAPPCVEIASGHSRPALAQLLQTSSIFYTYDDLSTLSIEARLCGCPVKIIGYTCLDKNHLIDNPFTLNGVAIPGEPVDLDKLKSEIPAFRLAYDAMQRKSMEELDAFIRITQNSHEPYVEDIVVQAPQHWLPIRLFADR